MKRKIIVCNREVIENAIFEESHIVISIRNPGSLIPILPKNPKRIGFLAGAFHDIGSPCEGLQHFVEGQAQDIWDFILTYPTEILIVVQCEAGISRSAGIAAAIAKCLDDDDSYFFKRYLPNTLVYAEMINVYRGQRRQFMERTNRCKKFLSRE